jgi:amino acid adenylation domain-containing protein
MSSALEFTPGAGAAAADSSIGLTGRAFNDHSSFWRERVSLLDEPFVLPIPIAASGGGSGPARDYVSAPVLLTPECVSAIRRLTAVKELGVRVVLLSAMMGVAARYSGRRVITVRSPRLDRENARVRGATHVLFVERVEEGESLRAFVGRVRDTVARTYQYESYPFEALLADSGISLRAATNVTLALGSATAGQSLDGSEGDGLTVRLEDPAALAIRVEASDTGWAETFARHLARWLSAYDAMERRIRDIEILDEGERHRVLRTFNATAVPYPRESTIPGLVEEHARRTPDAVAVAGDGSTMTYGELDRQANRVAWYLRTKLGVRDDDLVAVVLPRSAETVMALLGIMKAGAAYFPLDPSYPSERLGMMVRDACPAAIITDSEHRDVLPPGMVARVFALDVQAAELEREPARIPPWAVTAEHLAYVMYTSGSTGAPKGVAVPHRGVVRLVRGPDYIRFRPDEVFLQAAPLSFDASVLEIWGALVNGARTVVLPSVTPTLQDLAAAVRAHGITTLWLTAGLFHLMVEEHLHALNTVRQLVAGGDVLSVAHVRKARALLSARIVNGYGPTESTTFACCHAIGEGPFGGSVPIGRPIANTEIYILDAQLRPVPWGVPGELFIGGDGLARGYHGRPDATAERFIPDPFSGRSGSRLYRTGDRGRHLQDGAIEFLGRLDRQVKIRGFRVEPSEVEYALLSLPGVKAAVVLVEGESSSEKQLRAYVVSSTTGHDLNADRILSAIRSRIPEYMVPSIVRIVEKIPLTANGKLDAVALRGTRASETDRQVAYVAPSTSDEGMLADIWEDVLGCDRVGLDDNFFSLGGDSLCAIQILARLNERGSALSVQDLFDHPTIRTLVGCLRRPRADATGEVTTVDVTGPLSLVSAEDRAYLPANVEDAYPITQLQAGMLFHSTEGTKGLYHDIFSFHLDFSFCLQTLEAALRAQVQRHPVLRTSFHVTGFDTPLQLVHRAADIPCAVDDLTHLTDEEQQHIIDAVILQEKAQGFAWERAPLVRLRVHIRGEHRFQLTLVFHHALLDGWSVATLFTALFQDYAARMEGPPHAALPPPTASFRHFVALERAALASPEAKRFWSELLEDTTITQIAPADIERKPSTTDGPNAVDVNIPSKVLGELQRLSSTLGVPLKSVLLAAHVKVLSIASGQSDVVTGAVSHGRPETTDADQVLGLFLNTLPFRQRLSRGSWANLVRQTFELERQLTPFRRYPLAQMQKEQGRMLFQTVFNFVNFHVYQAVQRLVALRFLGATGFEQTNFPFAANFVLNPLDSQLRLELRYDRALLTVQQARRIRDLYARVLESIALEPDRAHHSPRLLSPDERLLLESYSTGNRNTGTPVAIHERVLEQVRRRPEAAAVVEGSNVLTYGVLGDRSARLAARLMRLGIKTESRVALVAERSADLVVGALAVLRIHAAYVPIDPVQPNERIRLMVCEAGVHVLLTQSHLKERLASVASHVLVLGDERRGGEEDAASDLPQVGKAAVLPGQLAYVIFTSGSTGTPKGVAVSHQALLNLIDWHVAEYHVTDRDRATLIVSPGFDASVSEIWPYLTSGATLYIPDAETRTSPQALARWMSSCGVTLTAVPTPLTEELLEVQSFSGGSLRALLTGGDRLRKRLRPEQTFQLVNQYGPAEAAVVSTSGAVVDGKGSPPSIGRPIANVRVYVLDQEMVPVPIGVAGELYVGGVGLARGYVNRPELTAERFVPDPFSAEPGQRLYRTGDVGRFATDGALEYIARLDEQLKIRGHRVEPGEIEAALHAMPGVREAVVLGHQEEGMQRRLVAYIVPSSSEVDVSAMAGALSEKLPPYMVPSAFVALPSLPRGVTGKVDRRQLPAPITSALPNRVPYEAPETATEQALAAIWADVLQVGRVGIHDNFFDLGGDSILSIQVVGRASGIGIEFTPTDLFRYPTVAKLAQVARNAQSEPGLTLSPANSQGTPQVRDIGKLRESSNLEEYITPSAHMALDKPPLAPDGNLDRDALSAPEQSHVVAKRGGQKPTRFSPMVPLTNSAEGRPFFCVHSVTGNVLAYPGLARRLAPEVSFYALESPGLDGEQPPLDSIEAMATYYLASVRGVQPTGPYRLGGWSMGGKVAFEMARVLEQQGENVELLALIDCCAVDLGPPEGFDGRVSAAWFVESAARSLGLTVPPLELGADLPEPDEVLLRRLLHEGQSAGVLTEGGGLEHLRAMYRTFDCNLRAQWQYAPGQYRGKVTLFRATELVPGEALDGGWGRLAVGGVEVHPVPGNHISMLASPNVDVLANELRATLMGAVAT